jgi:hypothetical protein
MKKITMNKIIFLFGLIMMQLSFITDISGQPGSKEIISQIDKQPKPRQLTYSPADGSVVELNPPPFIWVPVEPVSGNYKYILQISMDKEFKGKIISRRGIDISTYALEETLEPGEWYWRYGVEGGNGEWFWRYGMEKGINDHDTYPTLSAGTIPFSKPRKFIVNANTKAWCFPGIRYVMKSIPQIHPRLFILQDELGAYRYRARYGDLKDLIFSIAAECDEHIGEALIAEVPYTKSILEFLKTPGIDVGAKYQDETCPFTRYYMNMMEKFGALYLLTGDEKYGEEAKRRILHFYSWDPAGSTSYYENNEASMWMLYKGISTYDWAYNLFTDDERKKVEEVMKVRLSTLYELLRYNNVYHSYNFQSHPARMCSILAEGALCFANKWPEAEDWLRYVLTVYWNLYPTWGKDDGAWHEGPSYYNLYMEVGLHFILALKKATGIDFTEKEFFKNTPYYFLYTNPPYARMSPFGDLQHLSPSHTTPDYELVNRGELMYQLSTLMNDPYARWYAEYNGSGPGKNMMGILLKNNRLVPKSPSDLPQSRYFPGVGLVSMHTDLGNGGNDIHFLFHSDPYGAISHSRPDQNAFTLEAFGEALAIAGGYYPWWNSEHNKKWSYATRSANSVTIDGGKGQAFQDAEAAGKIAKFESTDLFDYALGDAAKAYKGLLNKFNRHVVHIRPGIFVILDELEAPVPVYFEWWMHALSEMKTDAPNKDILVSQGDARLKIRFLQSGKVGFSQIKGFPDAPPEHGEPDQWHVIASPGMKSTKATFLTLLVAYKNGLEPAVAIESVTEKTDEISIVLTFNGKKYFVGFLPDVDVKLME